MTTIVHRTVSDMPETSRFEIEQLVGSRLESNQRVSIIVESPLFRRVDRTNTRRGRPFGTVRGNSYPR